MSKLKIFIFFEISLAAARLNQNCQNLKNLDYDLIKLRYIWLEMEKKRHVFRWFLPTSIRSKTESFLFDLTKDCKVFLDNPMYYGRTVKFDRQHDFDQEFTASIDKITIKIHPFTSEPLSNFHGANKILTKEIGDFPDYKHIIDRGNLRKAKGLVIIEIEFNGEYTYTENLKIDEETDIEKMMNWDMDFEEMRQKMISLSNDIFSFFLLALHLTYPTHLNSHESYQPQSSGLLSFEGSGRYVMDEHSDIFSYPLLLEIDRIGTLNLVLRQISFVWHMNIWSFYRFLKGTRSDFVSIDQFLDLVFTLESFFDKSTSSEVMKLVSSLIPAKTKADADDIYELLTNCFKIRNEVAHGGRHYRLYDNFPTKKNGAESKVLIIKLYWGLKNLNITLLQYGISKILNDRRPIPAASIRFGMNDIIAKCFPE